MSDFLNNLLLITDNKLIKTLIVVLVALVVQQIVRWVIDLIFNAKISNLRRGVQIHTNRKRLRTVGSLVRATAMFLIWFIAILTIINIFKIPLAPLLTSAGLIGAALAFGMQSLIKDFISGVLIIFENQYRVDDYIVIDKVSGRVEAISLRTTAIRDDDGSLHHIPNGSIIITTNLSMGKLEVEEQIEISHQIDLEQLRLKVDKIAGAIAKSEEYSEIVRKGPYIKGIDKISKDSKTVSIAYGVTASKRRQAKTIILMFVEKEKIPLA